MNALNPITLPTQTRSSFTHSSASFTALPSGFNLIAHASSVTPSQFNALMSTTPPAVGVVATDNFSSLWACDAIKVAWFFNSPLLESSGGLPAVKACADSCSYQHLQDFNKRLDAGG